MNYKLIKCSALKWYRFVIGVLAVIIMTTVCACEREPKPEPEPVNQFPIVRDAVIDIDGNHYDAVKIGEQYWTCSNMKTAHFADGTAIPFYPSGHYADHSIYYHPYRLVLTDFGDKETVYYTWYVCQYPVHDTLTEYVQGVCPDGWHMPFTDEWQQLSECLSNMGQVSSPAKMLAQKTKWAYSTTPNTPGYNPQSNNLTGFSAFPTGVWPGGAGGFVSQYTYRAYWWTSDTTKCGVYIDYDEEELFYSSSGLGLSLLPVRCVKNQ